MKYMDTQKTITNGTSFIILGIVLLLPLFFLPITRDFLILTKFYFVLFAILAILIGSFVQLIITKKITLHRNPFAPSLFLILIAVILSTLLMSPNKIQALLSPRFGFLLFASLSVFFLFLTDTLERKKKDVQFFLGVSGFVASLIAIVTTIQPFKGQTLPGYVEFLNSASFNTVGSQIELTVFLGFVFTYLLVYFITQQKETVSYGHAHNGHGHHGTHTRGAHHIPELRFVNFVFFIVITIGLCLQVYALFKALIINSETLLLAPWDISWFAAVETLKSPLSAIFGVGVNNFPSVFAKVKDVGYNMSNLWQIAAFTVSRSTFLHVLSEAGLVALAGFLLIFVKIYETFGKTHILSRVLVLYGIVSLLLFPPSLISFFVFFLGLAFYAHDVNSQEVGDTYVLDFTNVLPLYITSVVISALVLVVVFLFGLQAFVSEVKYGQALQAVRENNLKKLYDNQRKAISFNPFNEEFRRDFSNTNMIIANNFAAKGAENLTDKDRQTITDAIQAAIAESKAAVSLNPQNVINWQHLASTYKNLINVAQGSGDWTVASYQRAIILDPYNPAYRLELGGLFYLAQNYDQAEKFFEQSASLKPDWPNAYYNLAWTYYQKGQYENAVTQMQRVVSLLDAEKDKADLAKAQQDMDVFVQKLQEQGGRMQDTQAPDNPDDLLLPSPPEASVEPKIELEEDAAPPEEGEEGDITLPEETIDPETGLPIDAPTDEQSQQQETEEGQIGN